MKSSNIEDHLRIRPLAEPSQKLEARLNHLFSAEKGRPAVRRHSYFTFPIPLWQAALAGLLCTALGAWISRFNWTDEKANGAHTVPVSTDLPVVEVHIPSEAALAMIQKANHRHGGQD